MGCDIHAAIEYRTGDQWKALMFPNRYYSKEYDEMSARLDLQRDYDLFAILANVRNGRGFAGVKTGNGFRSISDNRGLPEDISAEARETGCTGDHSETWVSLCEILQFDWQQIATLHGVLDAPTFERFDRMRQWNEPPSQWSGDVFGGSVVKLSEEGMRAAIKAVNTQGMDNLQIAIAIREALPHHYTHVSWTKSYAECAEQIWTKILPHMLGAAKEHGIDNVRLVMNFDS